MKTVNKLRTFEEFDPAQRARMLAEVDEQLASERRWVYSWNEFENPVQVIGGIGLLVRIAPNISISKYGVVSPIRLRVPDPRQMPVEQSYPLLFPRALATLEELASAAHGELRSYLPEGVDDLAFSVTSLLRTVACQKHISSAGKLANTPKDEFTSSHCYGTAFDIDHGGGYVLIDGKWAPSNPNNNPEPWMTIRERMRGVFGEILTGYADSDLINYIDEVPDGWGVFHVAVNPTIEPTDDVERRQLINNQEESR